MAQKPTAQSLPRLAVSVAEAEHALGLSKTSIHKLIRTGKLKSVKIGTARRIPVEAIEALLAPPCRETGQA